MAGRVMDEIIPQTEQNAPLAALAKGERLA